MTTFSRPSTAREVGAVLEVDGVSTYYEVVGAGEPVVLLHGGMCTAETWDAQTAALSARYRVFVPERFGHGRTPDIDGPLTYESMARHAIAFMEATGLENAHLVGWSDGALVGLLVALRRPGLVRKLVLIDQFVELGGAPSWYGGFMSGMTAETAPAGMVQMYAALSADGPAHFPVVFEKLHRLWTSPTGVELADLERVQAPTLVLAADDGSLTVEHAAAIKRALPVAQLAVVPGTSHAVAWEKPDLVNRLLLDFLADEQPAKMFSFDG
jgi:pimeloyl-ACP methyl ester carboxylesterase